MNFFWFNFNYLSNFKKHFLKFHPLELINHIKSHFSLDLAKFLIFAFKMYSCLKIILYLGDFYTLILFILTYLRLRKLKCSYNQSSLYY